jgi:hypothetical protein
MMVVLVAVEVVAAEVLAEEAVPSFPLPDSLPLAVPLAVALLLAVALAVNDPAPKNPLYPRWVCKFFTVHPLEQSARSRVAIQYCVRECVESPMNPITSTRVPSGVAAEGWRPFGSGGSKENVIVSRSSCTTLASLSGADPGLSHHESSPKPIITSLLSTATWSLLVEVIKMRGEREVRGW